MAENTASALFGVEGLCVKHLRGSLTVVVAFEGQQRAWIVLAGRHDDQDPVLNVDAGLYRLLGVEPPDGAGGDKSPCCDQSTDLPPVLGAAVNEFVDRAAKVRRTRRQPALLPVCGAAVEQGHGQGTRALRYVPSAPHVGARGPECERERWRSGVGDVCGGRSAGCGRSPVPPAWLVGGAVQT